MALQGQGGADALPACWEKQVDSSGRVFYKNHILRSTAWELPTQSEYEVSIVQTLHTVHGVGFLALFTSVFLCLTWCADVIWWIDLSRSLSTTLVHWAWSWRQTFPAGSGTQCHPAAVIPAPTRGPSSSLSFLVGNSPSIVK